PPTTRRCASRTSRRRARCWTGRRRWTAPTASAARSTTSAAPSPSRTPPAWHDGRGDRDRGPARVRAARVRGRARLLPRSLPRPALRRPRRDVRAGQPLALEARRRARAALPGAAPAGQADPRRPRRGLRRGGGPPPRLADVRAALRHRAFGREPPPALDSTRLRARLRRPLGLGRRALQVHRSLPPGRRGRPPLGRPGARDRLAGRDADPLGARSAASDARRARARSASGRAMRLLVTGANGQVGHALARQGGAAVIGLDRAALDITDREAVRRAVQQHAPDLVVNAAAYTAVDRAEAEEETAFAVNCDGPAHL